MRSILALILPLAVLQVALAEETSFKTTFAKEQLGKLPDAMERAQTGDGDASAWKVVADATAPSKAGFVLAQTAAAPKATFNLAVVKKGTFENGTVSVKFKSVGGKIDQGGGVVWRYQDAKNYYVARYNPLEDNLRVYKVVNGVRMQLGTKEGLAFPAGEWHTLSITHDGKKITCAIDGKTHLEAEDDAIARAGRVGLWTKADAQTYFDELDVKTAGEKN
jgi:hypothetical protein